MNLVEWGNSYCLCYQNLPSPACWVCISKKQALHSILILIFSRKMYFNVVFAFSEASSISPRIPSMVAVIYPCVVKLFIAEACVYNAFLKHADSKIWCMSKWRIHFLGHSSTIYKSWRSRNWYHWNFSYFLCKTVLLKVTSIRNCLEQTACQAVIVCFSSWFVVVFLLSIPITGIVFSCYTLRMLCFWPLPLKASYDLLFMFISPSCFTMFINVTESNKPR